mmetsp:Transcript_559/g.1755  ORF Transcript_559/g.1755 Transcript_559/m.1755 type:complete len:320 (-) Transcript_559:858-1817(-)
MPPVWVCVCVGCAWQLPGQSVPASGLLPHALRLLDPLDALGREVVHEHTADVLQHDAAGLRATHEEEDHADEVGEHEGPEQQRRTHVEEDRGRAQQEDVHDARRDDDHAHRDASNVGREDLRDVDGHHRAEADAEEEGVAEEAAADDPALEAHLEASSHGRQANHASDGGSDQEWSPSVLVEEPEARGHETHELHDLHAHRPLERLALAHGVRHEHDDVGADHGVTGEDLHDEDGSGDADALLDQEPALEDDRLVGRALLRLGLEGRLRLGLCLPDLQGGLYLVGVVGEELLEDDARLPVAALHLLEPGRLGDREHREA